MVVTIDGPAGAGKSSVAKSLAARLGFCYLDSGAYYRAIALLARQANQILTDDAQMQAFLATLQLELNFSPHGVSVRQGQHDLSGAIRTPQVSQDSSLVARLPAVRQWVLHQLRQWENLGNVIAEGRDMGSVVFPRAEVKIFLDASPAIRAHRRFLEFQAKGLATSESAVQQDLGQRDRQDQERSQAPLQQPADAHVINSSAYSLEEIVTVCLALIQPLLQRQANRNH